MRDKAGLLVGVAPQDLRGRVRDVVNRHGAQLQAQADVGHLQQDHGPVRAGPQDLLHQAQVGYLHRHGAVSEAFKHQHVGMSPAVRGASSNVTKIFGELCWLSAAAEEAYASGLQGRIESSPSLSYR